MWTSIGEWMGNCRWEKQRTLCLLFAFAKYLVFLWWSTFVEKKSAYDFFHGGWLMHINNIFSGGKCAKSTHNQSVI